MNFTSYLIASHPDVQAKIHAELDTIFGGKYPSINSNNQRSSTDFHLDDKERPCKLEDVQDMTYLDLVVKVRLIYLDSSI